MTIPAAQLADLRGKAKLYLAIGDDDPSFHADALAIYDDLTNNTTSTVAVTPAGVVLVGDDSGTDTVTFSSLSADTLADLIEAIESANANLVVTPLIDTGEVAASDLIRLSATSIAGQQNEQTLKVERNALIDLLIEGTVAGIEAFLGRSLYSATYTERVYPGSGVVTLNQPNVTSVELFAVEPTDAIVVGYTGSDRSARVEVTDESVILRSSGATTTTTTLTFASSADTATLASAIAAVSGWTATARVTVPSTRLIRSGSWDVRGNSVELQVWDDFDNEYEVDYPEGQIRVRIPSVNAGWTYRGMGQVVYTAGYDTLPRDLEQVVLSLVKSSYSGVQRDGSLISERLGDYAYTVSQDVIAGGTNNAAIGSQLAVLDRYRRMLP